MSFFEIDKYLKSIDHNLRELLHKLFPIPNKISLQAQGDFPMGAPVTATVGDTINFVTTEFDTTTTPPTSFPIVPANLVYTQDTTTLGSITINPDGTASLITTAAGAVTVTVTDTLSNPGTTLTDSVTATVSAKAEVPNQAVLTATVVPAGAVAAPKSTAPHFPTK